MAKHSYNLLTTLSGQHDDTIACMQFSPCGKYLVTGGDDLRMNVFDCTDEFRNILSISSTSPASTICWDTTEPRSCFVGYSSGAVVSHTFGDNSEEWAAEILLFNGRCRVVALAWDKVLAVATEKNVCLISGIKASTDIQRGTVDISPPATNYRQPEPRSVCFTADGSLIIAYLEHGVVCWSSDGKTLKWSFTPRAFRIGRFFYSLKADLFAVHNLYDGFDAYKMKSRTHFRSYRFPVSEKDNVPLSCVLINDGRHIVCGTTSGKAVVLDAITLAHQADLFHCETGLVQDIAYCNVNGANLLATTASEKGAETTIKIWAADVTPCQSTSYADRTTDAFRSGIDLLGDVCARLIGWHNRTVEITVLSLILWMLVILAASVAIIYLNASNLEGFRLFLRSTWDSFWVASKEALSRSGQMCRWALRYSVRACYSFLKGFMVTLYEILEEEEPSPHTDIVNLASTGFRTVQENGLEFGDTLEMQSDHSPDGAVVSEAQANDIIDWSVHVGFSHVEDAVAAAEDFSSGLLDHRVAVGEVCSSLDQMIVTDIVEYGAV